MIEPFDGEEEVLQRLVAEMLALPSGTTISTARLVYQVYGEEARKFSNDQLIQIAFDLKKAGRKAGIRFEKPCKGTMIMGLPFVFDFIIQHKN